MNRVKLNDIAWFQEGPGVRNTQYTSEGVKLLNVSNLVNGTLDLSNSKRYISEEEAYGKYKHFLCDSGDLVIASSGITEANVNSKNAFIGSDDLPLCMNTSTIRFKSTNSVSLKYLFYFFRSKDFLKQIRVLMHGSAQLNFGPSHLKLITVPIIDKKEELELCNYLDLLRNSIKVKQNELNELDNLIKSRFIEMFGDLNASSDGYVSLDSFAKISSSKRIHVADYVESGVSFYRSKEIIELGEGKEPSIELYISNDLYKSICSKNYIPQRGDILMSAVGTIGKMWIVDGKREFYYKDGNILCIHSDKTNPVFLKHTLENLIDSFKKSNVNGSAYAALTIVKLNKMLVPLPERKLQDEFASFIELIDKSKFISYSRYFL